jgi:hypothetical protein
MAVRQHKYELSMQDRLRRSLYDVLREQLEICLMKHALVDSYRRLQPTYKWMFVSNQLLVPLAKYANVYPLYHKTI